jgi:arginyl-tRNA synthetase
LRAKKVLEKVTVKSGNWQENFAETEKNLIKKIVQYRDVLAEAVAEMAPHKICAYLYELAQEFSRFYENCPVVGNEFEYGRAKITAVYAKTMLHGLNILGIEVPKEM